MRWTTLLFKELRERPTAVLSALLAIVLGTAALVTIRNISVFSEQKVAQDLEALGANVLLLPKGVTLQDYYAADQHGQTMPEEHAGRLALANLQGVENISPKLCVAATLGERNVTLTGILPQSEFRTKAAWQGMSMFSNQHAGCKRACVRKDENADKPEALATRRVVENLGEQEAIIGAELAELTKVKAGDSISLLGEKLNVIAVLPRTGSADDGRVFAHLHTVQRLVKAGDVVNVIEIMACCEDAAGNLITDLGQMFPDVKVATISHVVEAQVAVNRLMGRLSWLFLAILVVLGGASMAGSMYANVRERRREIGTLMALGATRGFVTRLFLGKAVLLGLTGGAGGYLLGSALAYFLGPRWAGIDVQPLPVLAGLSIGISMTVTCVAAFLPASKAANLDPCTCFQEV